MISLVIASMFAAASVDTAASAQRGAFSTCLKEAVARAKSDKLASDAFDSFARAQCAGPEADLSKAVVALDLKNGISRKDAAENARLELDDYFVVALERYQAEAGRSIPAQAQAQAQTQAQAQPPQQPQQ